MTLFQSMARPATARSPSKGRADAEALASLLGPHGVLEPLTARAALFEVMSPTSARAQTGAVWKDLQASTERSDRLLNLRHFAVLGLQTRLRRLVPNGVDVANLALRLFLSPHTDHAYVEELVYQRMADGTDEALGLPYEFPVFIDARRECLVIDTSRGFENGDARVTAATVHGVAAMSESPRFAVCLQEHAHWLDTVRVSQRAAFGLVLQATARCVLRAALGEPNLQMSPLARQLADQAGMDVVARALLTGAAAEARLMVGVFMDLWRDRPSGSGTNTANSSPHDMGKA